MENNNDDDQEGIQVGNIHDEFSEVETVVNLIDNISNISDDHIALEVSDEEFLKIIDEYLEQPHLLDPHLDRLLKMLLAYIQDQTVKSNVRTIAFKYLYYITKVRGHKIMVRKFPHEVNDFEPILRLLETAGENESWETKYMLLLWLSMICLIPFDMVLFDDPEKVEINETKSVIWRVLEIGKFYLMDSSNACQVAASLMLSKFVTRPDINKENMLPFVEWCLNFFKTSNPNEMVGVINLKGSLSVLSKIFKQGRRENILSLCSVVLEAINESDILTVTNSVLRKLTVKLVQRLGMTFLKPREAPWRYKRGTRSLNDMMTNGMHGNKIEEMDSSEEVHEENVDDFDIPEDIENVIEILLNALKDKDTIVRWSAAKGIGRITGRLPKEFADEVVQSIFENFSISETDGAWHAGCLALAELGRRGLLLPDRLSNVVVVLQKALLYDERRGTFSIGAHVRDAACYLAWSLARAFEPSALKPYVNRIAQALLVTTLFDREVNCRRAASAAFQENVGRQGYFPFGIEILSLADYFAVSQRSRTYLEIAPKIGHFSTYTVYFIKHLINHMYNHWDGEIRWLAAKSMHHFAKIKPELVSKDILSEIVPKCSDIDLVTRHGSILMVAEIIHSLYEVEVKRGAYGLLAHNGALKDVFKIVPFLRDSHLYRGYGGELMRIASCHLITRLSECRDTVKPHKSTLASWNDLIHNTLSNLHTFTNSEEICATAVAALSAMNNVSITASPFTNISNSGDAGDFDSAVEQYLAFLTSDNHQKRCGYAQAIGALPNPIVIGRFNKIVTCLATASCPKDASEVSFVESRSYALKAIFSICLTAGISKNNDVNGGVCEGNVEQIYETFLHGLDDYTRDRRGDVGSIVRTSAVESLHQLTCLLSNSHPKLLTQKIMTKVACGIVQQACEKLHKLRDFSAWKFVDLIHNHKVPFIPNVEELRIIFGSAEYTMERDESRGMVSFNMSSLFSNLTKLLNFPDYSYFVLLGLIVSIGDLTRSLAEASGAALFEYMDEIRTDQERMATLSKNLVEIFRFYSKQDRISIPLLKTLHQLLVKDCFAMMETETTSFASDVLSLVKTEISRSRDAQKLLLSVSVFSDLLQFEQQGYRSSVVSQIMILLCHRFPTVRKNTATQLYENVLTYEDLIQDSDNIDIVLTLIGETEWDQPVTTIKPIRNELCGYFGVPIPRLKKDAPPAK